MDVVFVGGGPAGLAGAIELARLVKRDNEAGGGLGDIEIAVLEKAGALGEHCLSGRGGEPARFPRAVPGAEGRGLPVPRAGRAASAVYLLTRAARSGSRRRRRCATTATTSRSICEMVRWLGEKAEELGVNMFTGFPAGRRCWSRASGCVGVRTTPAGLEPRRRAAARLHAADGHHGAKVTVARRGDARAAVAGVAASGRGPLGEPADLRAGRQGDLGDEGAARRGRPHARVAAARATRSAGASCTRSSRTWSRSAWSWGSTTSDVDAGRARAAPADEAAPALPAATSRAARWWSGAPRRSPKAATTRCRSGVTATGC